MSETDPRTAYLALSFHAFGWGDTPAEARGNCRGNVSGTDLKKHGMVIYRVHPKAELSLIDGSISSPKGHPPIKVQDSRPVKWTKKGTACHEAHLIARTVAMTWVEEPLPMWQVTERGGIIGGTGARDLKQAKAYVEKLLKGVE